MSPAGELRKAKRALLIQMPAIGSLTASPVILACAWRSSVKYFGAIARCSFATMSKDGDPNQLEAIVQKKRALRSKIRRALKNMDPLQRSQEVMQASGPINLFILPGLAFDRSGRRLGRSMGCTCLLCTDGR
ncbi:uncharacterized protein LOC127789017 [Diospyros lotus]|uniref:uncharacterized protein LOC127789017 n=1 Tax=Diospyros lotus TaxID=55363 RepID=UPI00224CC935|nr:uncharacterized protein LOC127789017 [Diospyros lotus]